tara:strand:+ start:2900 stop:4117 length:1218 start_codon:yes stop_codon:yes gene_type:complete
MKHIFIIIFILITSNTISQENKSIIIDKMKYDVAYLASDKLRGRKTGTCGEKKAAQYIAEKFKQNKLSEKGEDGYFQSFNAIIQSNPHKTGKGKDIEVINVVGFCDNQKEETIIIGAHYDHLGRGGHGSLYAGKKKIHNGADDNASGVSILINLIDLLCENNLYNYLFIAFSGEELGLLGSSYFAKNPTIDLQKVRFMLNFDMVGRLNTKRELALNGVGTSNQWGELINKANTYNFKLITSESGIGPSDHTSFYLQEIPVLHFFTGQHEDYHKPTDDVEKINFNGMHSIMSYAKDIITKSATIENFTYQETINDTQQTPKFNVTLGIMPDYLYNDHGLRIDGVTKGKTADKHGILKGDIVIQIGDIEVTDIMKYMEGLSNFQKGDSTIIKIKRENETITIPITFK